MHDLLTLAYLKRQWLPYLKEHPDVLDDTYYRVLRLFPKADPTTLRSLFDKQGQLQAAASIDIERDPVYINLLIAAPWRAKGSGSRLLRRIIAEALDLGSAGVMLSAEPEAISFYLKHGFYKTSKPLKPWHTTNMRLDENAARSLVRG